MSNKKLEAFLDGEVRCWHEALEDYLVGKYQTK